MEREEVVQAKEVEEKRMRVRGLHSNEITSYANLVLGFKHVGGTAGLLKRTENGQNLVFVQSSCVIMHIYRGYHVYIPGYTKNPFVEARNLVKEKFVELLQEADFVFIPIVIVYNHAKNCLRNSNLAHNSGHCNLVVYRKSDQRYFIMDCLLTSKHRLKSYVCAKKVQQRVIPFFRKTFNLQGTSKKCWSSTSFPVNNGCGIFLFWCIEKFTSDPTWTPDPHIVFPSSRDVQNYTKMVVKKLLQYKIDLTRKRATEEEKQKDENNFPRSQNPTEVQEAITTSDGGILC